MSYGNFFSYSFRQSKKSTALLLLFLIVLTVTCSIYVHYIWVVGVNDIYVQAFMLITINESGFLRSIVNKANNFRILHTLQTGLAVLTLLLLLVALYEISKKNEEGMQVEQALRESERSKALLLSNLPGIAYRCNYDQDWTLQFVSEGCFDLTGYKAERLLKKQDIVFYDLINPEYREFYWEKWTETLETKTVFREEYPITTASGEVKWVFEQGRGIYDENGEVKTFAGLLIDVTNIKKREDEIRYLSYHDVLTGLYNRRFFEEEKQRIDNENWLPLSIIIGDINGLKLINEALGHAEGDKIIMATAKILSDCCREGDVIARTSGGEFSVLLPKTSNEDAYKIMKELEI